MPATGQQILSAVVAAAGQACPVEWMDGWDWLQRRHLAVPAVWVSHQLPLLAGGIVRPELAQEAASEAGAPRAPA